MAIRFFTRCPSRGRLGAEATDDGTGAFTRDPGEERQSVMPAGGGIRGRYERKLILRFAAVELHYPHPRLLSDGKPIGDRER